MSNLGTLQSSHEIHRGTLSALLVIGPTTPKHSSAYPAHDALVTAGYATKSPMGDGRFEYQITKSGIDYLDATRRPKE